MTTASDLDLLAARLLEGGARTPAYDEALRGWFEPLGAPPPGALAASSPDQLLSRCDIRLRPRAIELHDLLASRAGEAVIRSSPPQRLWVMLDRGGDALALRLSAWRVQGPAGLAADAGLHALAERDLEYRRAEAAACRVLAAHHPQAAVRYSLTTIDGDPFRDPIGDGSLGAALAVAALSACRRGSPFALDHRGAVTGSLTSDGRIGSVDQRGLKAKAVAARHAGARRLVVPADQAARLPGVTGIALREAATVEEARRQMRILRPLARAALAVLLVALLATGAIVHAVRSERQDELRTALAAERAMERALEVADDNPQRALQLAAAAGLLEPEETAPARALLAVALPPGLRFLPDLPAPATALSWRDGKIVAATGRRAYEIVPGGSHWRRGRRLPAHGFAAFSGREQLVMGGARGAWTLDLRRGKSVRLSHRRVRSVAGGGGMAAVLTATGVVVALRGDRAERVASPARLVAIAVSSRGDLFATDGLGRLLRDRRGRFVLTDGNVPISSSVGFRRLGVLAAEGAQAIAADDGGSLFTRSSYRPDGVGPTGPPVSALLSLPNDRGVAIRRNAYAEVFDTDGVYLTVRLEQRLPGAFSTAATSADGRRLVVAGRQAALLRLDQSRPSTVLLTEALAFDRNGGLLGLGRTFGGVMRLARNSWSELIPPPGRSGDLGAPVFSPNGRWAAQMEPKGRVRIFDLWNRRVSVHDFDYANYDGPIDDFSQHMGMLDDGRISLSRSEEDEFAGTTYLVDPATEKAERVSYNGYGPFARELAPGRLLLARGEHVDLIRLEDMKLLRTATVIGALVNTLTASANGKIVFFGTSSGDLWSWTPAEESARPRRLGQVDGGVISLVALGDGSVLFGTASRGLRRPARIFAVDVADANVKLLDLPEVSSFARLALSPDRRRLAIPSSKPVGATLLVTHLDPREACSRAGGEVSAAVWHRAIGGLSVKAPSCPGG